MTKPYRPSNGTEGDSFMSAFCFNGCVHHTDEKPCQIMGRSLAYGIDDPQYPKEWVEEDDGTRSRCTAFSLENKPVRCSKTIDMFGDKK